jgi:integrase/recombinase XerD
MTINQAVGFFLSGYFSGQQSTSKTKAAYSSDLMQFKQFVGPDLLVNSLMSSTVEEWASSLLRRGYAPASIKRKIVALKVFCSYWIRKQEMTESPFWRINLKFGRIEKLPRTLTTTEIHALLMEVGRVSQADSPEYVGGNTTGKPRKCASPRYRQLRDMAMIDLLFATGIRVGELASLNVGDYSVQDSAFTIRGKGGRERLAFTVDKKTFVLQQEHLQARITFASDDPALFISSQGSRLTTQSISKVLGRTCRAAGIERRITPHMLRHTVATLLLRNGADIRIVQDFLGHSSIVTTQRYTHIVREHLVDALTRHHPSIRLRMITS